MFQKKFKLNDKLRNKDFGKIASFERDKLYTEISDDKFVFQNPIFSQEYVKTRRKENNYSSKINSEMKLSFFLSSIPSFADFSDDQFVKLEEQAIVKCFPPGDILFRQGDQGDAFYVIQNGTVDVLVQETPSLLRNGDFGKVVNRLTQGSYFGERALMTSEVRAATIRATESTDCLVFPRAIYEDIISRSTALIGKNAKDDVDLSKDHETRALLKHVENILDIEKQPASAKIRRILYELTTAFTPELSVDEVISRMVLTVKSSLKADRVGLFVLNADRQSMILKVSERSKGILLPVRGLAGVVIESNHVLNIADAYQDKRFDATMDRRTGYRTRQVLGVPLQHPLTGEAIGLLQVNNKSNDNLEGFTLEQQKLLELAAAQLSELLMGRQEIFLHSGMESSASGFGASNDVATVVSSAEIATSFCVTVSKLQLTKHCMTIIAKESITTVEITIGLYLAMTSLCQPKVVTLELRGISGSACLIELNECITFDIIVRDLPRAARIIFRISGIRKALQSTRHSLGWCAASVFDFKGCIDNNIDLKMFPGDNEIPINTTLSNTHDTIPPSGLTAILASDLVTTDLQINNMSVKVVHSMPPRPKEILADIQINAFTSITLARLDYIRLLSFNPMCTSIMTIDDKHFLWELRYSILDRADLLPAIVMSVDWSNAICVQELYDLLDLWKSPTPIQALLLLDRKFMDPKVRAYASHCLENLADEELGLYMLQLCQQLKFENSIDSALSRFLLRRALTNQRLIGHMFFWLLQSEIYNLDVKIRFSSLLEVIFVPEIFNIC